MPAQDAGAMHRRFQSGAGRFAVILIGRENRVDFVLNNQAELKKFLIGLIICLCDIM
jgi:hypothetical protein